MKVTWANRLLLCLSLALSIVICPGAGANAQETEPSSFLFIKQERLLLGSKTGQALLAEENRARRALLAEARAIDAAFEEEEKSLDAQKLEMTAEEFRKIADDFDKRVIAARQSQDERSNDLALKIDQNRRQFYASVAPVLFQLMEKLGARAILDENSVLIADQSLDITDAVIAEIDKQSDSDSSEPE